MIAALLLLLPAGRAAPLVLYDLEASDGGFIESGETGAWEWGVVRNGPGAGYDGTSAWSTGLTRDYLVDTTDYLEIPIPDLTETTRPTLSFVQWYGIAAGDYAWIEANTGSGWEVLTPLYGYTAAGGFTGATGAWRQVVADLGSLGPTPRVRLAFQSDATGVSRGWTIDQVGIYDGDIAPPKLSGLLALTDTEDLEGPYVVTVSAEDDTGVTGVTLEWSGIGTGGTAAMTEVSPGLWQGEIPAQLPDTLITYAVTASDGVNTSREPAEEDLSFRVYLPAPTELVGPSGRVVGTSATLSWIPPVSQHTILGYEVRENDATVCQVAGPQADVPISGGLETFSVRAIYPEGVGDSSDSVVIDGVLPVVVGLSPAEAWPGDTLRVRLDGEYLLLVQDEVGVSLGEGITVDSVTVRDVDTAFVSLAIAADATAGPRSLVLDSGETTLELTDAFQILAGEDRPRLTGVEPASVRQGDTGEMTLAYVGTFAEPPAVDLGADVTVDAVTVAEDGALTVTYTVASDAALGDRAVVVDDGVRLFQGAAFEVKDALAPPARGCGTPVAPGAVAVFLAAIAAKRRRRA